MCYPGVVYTGSVATDAIESSKVNISIIRDIAKYIVDYALYGGSNGNVLFKDFR